jgi:predicted kinase
VRTKVALLRWQQHKNLQDFKEAENYANLAKSFSLPKPSLLAITHGFSGSGKSTLSAQLAETLGLIHLRSDAERQRLFGASKQGENREINQAIYSAEKIQFIYQKLADLSATMLAAGFSVLIDAAFLKSEQRNLFQQLAFDKGVKFLILDFYAPETELKRRITQRLQDGDDASEATLAVLNYQLKTAHPFTDAEQATVIQIDSGAEDTLEKLLKQIL